MGLGRRTFAPGEVLTASNVMNYLQDQAVMNFAGTAARGSAIGTAISEGMVSYINDTDSLEVYRAIGTAAPGWNPVAFVSNVPTLGGLVPITPTSISVDSGSGSVATGGEISFSGATAVRVNGVFTSTYKNYRVVANFSASGAADITFRARASGTDLAGNNYMYAKANSASTTYSIQTYTTNGNLINLARVNGSGFWTATNFDINSPELAQTTQITGQWVDGAFYGNCWASVLTLTQYDGFSIFGATITGTLKVYGYN
jgi:hypothetical protein